MHFSHAFHSVGMYMCVCVFVCVYVCVYMCVCICVCVVLSRSGM